MTWIMYSDTVPPGRYWNGPGENGGCIEVQFKEKTEKYLDPPGPVTGAPMLPPQVVGVGERWDRIDKSLETIAEALEGIYELLNRR